MATTTPRPDSVSTHSRPKAAGWQLLLHCPKTRVSTHSRPKAAGTAAYCCPPSAWSFNTQPPEGGWPLRSIRPCCSSMFQHTAARRRLVCFCTFQNYHPGFNTQPPEGGWTNITKPKQAERGFNTQPPEGGWDKRAGSGRTMSGFNTQPPEGGWLEGHILLLIAAMFQHTAARRRLAWPYRQPIPFSCFNTQPPEGGWRLIDAVTVKSVLFQHTAARRRLVENYAVDDSVPAVSTHSRPKAAGCSLCAYCSPSIRFNTQPPEGGWDNTVNGSFKQIVSTHSRPKAAGFCIFRQIDAVFVSTHSRPKAAG